ncbi:MAG: hypothetical protein U0Q12_06880 [Vicinamibacterales bacterium]
MWRIWTYNAVKYGPTTLYGTGGQPPERRLLKFGRAETTVDYPPLTLYELAATGALYEHYDPGFSNTKALTTAIKLVVVVAESVTAWLLYRTALQAGGSELSAWWATLAYWVSPATLLSGAVLGYLDALFLVPLIAAIHGLSTRRPAATGAALVAAAATKAQAVIVAPALALACWTTGGLAASGVALVGAAVAALALIGPVVLGGSGPNLVEALASLTRHDMLSGEAANLWWLVTYVTRAYFEIDELGVVGAYARPVERILAVSTWVDVLHLPNPRPFATLLVLGAAGWALWQVRRVRSTALVALAGAFLVHAYFMLAVGVHENHMNATVPLLALAGTTIGPARRLCYVVSLIIAINLNLFLGFGHFVGYALPRGLVPFLDLSVVLALANLAAFAWHARVLKAAVRAELAPAPAPGPATS